MPNYFTILLTAMIYSLTLSCSTAEFGDAEEVSDFGASQESEPVPFNPAGDQQATAASESKKQGNAAPETPATNVPADETTADAPPESPTTPDLPAIGSDPERETDEQKDNADTGSDQAMETPPEAEPEAERSRCMVWAPTGEPTEISSLEELRDQPFGYYRLTQDIALDDSFETIAQFYGVLDGNGYEISGATKPLFDLLLASCVIDLELT